MNRFFLCGERMVEKKAKTEEKDEVIIFDSNIVPKQEIMNKEDKKKLLDEFNISLKQLPRMRQTDPVVKILKAKKGDVLRISRNDPVIGEYFYYRVVI